MCQAYEGEHAYLVARDRRQRQANCQHKYKHVKCDGDRDTYRCTECEHEYTTACTFDEDYA